MLDLMELAPSTPRTMGKIRTLSEKLRTQFYASVEVDFSPGIHAISSPVLDSQGQAIATLSLGGSHR